MSRFEELRKLYEQGSDLDKISSIIEGILFLKVRSLAKDNLKDICLKKGLIERNRNIDIWKLRELVFNNSDNDEMNNFILNHKDELTVIENKEELISGVKEVEAHTPSVFMDTFDTVLKRVVRDKSIQRLSALKERIKNDILPKLESYVEWSWFNQNTNDLIEGIFNNHQKIIPTLRKVKGVDFFVKMDISEYPVDFKMTFLPREFIAKHSREGLSESDMIDMVKNNPKILADWLYENQNPRLFNNNMRFIIVLVDKENLLDSWRMKADYETIESETNSFLDNLSDENVIDVEYDYNKDDRFSGNYKTKCFLLIIEK